MQNSVGKNKNITELYNEYICLSIKFLRITKKHLSATINVVRMPAVGAVSPGPPRTRLPARSREPVRRRFVPGRRATAPAASSAPGCRRG